MATSPSANARILVADDSRFFSRILVSCLTKHGYEVFYAENGEECLGKVKSLHPDLIILDIVMPKIHGVEVLERLKADPVHAQIPVLMCSVRSYERDRRRCIELGAKDYIVKPFKESELIATVQEHLADHQRTEAPAPSPVTEPVDEFIPAIPPDAPRVRFWGTRGSIPVAGPQVARHGGNTTCIEMAQGNTVLVFDAGTGIRDLGKDLMARGIRDIHMFLTHTHWDHIQGLPFFLPAFSPEVRLVVYGVSGFEMDLESLLRGQLHGDYFPVHFDDMRATFDFVEIAAEPVVVGGIEISHVYTHHPGASVGYKARFGDRTVVFLSDNEFLEGYRGDPFAIERNDELLYLHETTLEFVSNADVLISEAQYTNEEYRTKSGWGHTALSNACLLAKLADVPRWIVTHHDPDHDDSFLDRKLSLTRFLLRELGSRTEIRHAFDGMVEYV